MRHTWSNTNYDWFWSLKWVSITSEAWAGPGGTPGDSSFLNKIPCAASTFKLRVKIAEIKMASDETLRPPTSPCENNKITEIYRDLFTGTNINGFEVRICFKQLMSWHLHTRRAPPILSTKFHCLFHYHFLSMDYVMTIKFTVALQGIAHMFLCVSSWLIFMCLCSDCVLILCLCINIVSKILRRVLLQPAHRA